MSRDIGLGGSVNWQQAPVQLQQTKTKSIGGVLADLEPVLGRLWNIQVEFSRIADRLGGPHPKAEPNKPPRPEAANINERLYNMLETLVEIAEGLEGSMRLIDGGL